MDNKPDPIYVNLSADDSETTEIESICMNCYKNVSSRMFSKSHV
jgi:hypothetical protein